ncbi:hypothetical protein DEBA109399_00765 [Dermacoccus barathri]
MSRAGEPNHCANRWLGGASGGRDAAASIRPAGANA